LLPYVLTVLINVVAIGACYPIILSVGFMGEFNRAFGVLFPFRVLDRDGIGSLSLAILSCYP
jgi:hypothetical protein